MLHIRNNSTRSKIVIFIFLILIVVDIVDTIFQGWRYTLLLGVQQNPASFSEASFALSDIILQALAIGNVVILILVIVFFIRWFRRAYYNVHAIPGSYVSFSEGWAAGSWFVPFLNLVRPFQIMRDIWVETQRVITHRLQGNQPVTLVGIWWAAYLVHVIFDSFFTRNFRNPQNVDEWVTATEVQIVSNVLNIAGAIMAIVLVKKMQVFERELWEEAQQPDDSVFSIMAETA
jgi:hypothetical protein